MINFSNILAYKDGKESFNKKKKHLDEPNKIKFCICFDDVQELVNSCKEDLKKFLERIEESGNVTIVLTLL